MPDVSNANEGDDEYLIAKMDSAARAVLQAESRHARTSAHQALRSAVSAANDVGVSWQTIGDVLGMARGNAYQRYRHRPRPEMATDPLIGMPTPLDESA